MELTEPIVKIMKTGRIDQDYQAKINSLAFHRAADLLVTAADDDSIKVYSLETGRPQQLLHSKKYGVAKVKFTHHPTAIIYASNKGSDHALRYLSVQENKFYRYLQGHEAKVTSLSVCPRSDLIMSTSQDKSMRLWDLRAESAQGYLEVPSGIPVAAFDLQGMVFSVGIDSGVIKLYDVRSFDKGPFTTFLVDEEKNQPASFAQLKFSPDGKMLTGVVGHKIYQLNAFDGVLQQKYSSGVPKGATPPEMCYSNDNKFLFSGHNDKSIRVWATDSGREAAVWSGGHLSVPTCIEFAPRRLLCASACNLLNLWIPSIADLKQLGLVN